MKPIQSVDESPGSGRAAWTSRLWTPSQRVTLCAVLLALSAVVLWRTRSSSRPIANDLPPAGQLADQIAGTLDPNTATAAELRLLPRVGQTLADRIVQYRQQQLPLQPGQPVFRKLKDLDPIPGIGPAMLEQLRPHLRFPEDSTAAHD